MKGKPRSVQKRKLHETPVEFAKAAKHKVLFARYYEVSYEEKKRREKIQNMKMPSHLAPRPKCICWAMGKPHAYESVHDRSYLKRLTAWKKRFDKREKNHSSST